MSGFLSWIWQFSDVVLVGGGVLTSGEADAWAVDFTYHTNITKQASLIDSGTPANNYDAAPYTKLTYTSPSLKLCRQADGVWRYGNHNIILQSQTFGTSWTANSGSVTADQATSPDGTMTADLFTEGGGNTFNVQTSTDVTTVAGMSYQWSFYAKSGGAIPLTWIRTTVANNGSTSAVRQWFKLTDGTVGTSTAAGSGYTKVSASMTSVGDGWYRCVFTVVVGETASEFYIISADSDGGTGNDASGNATAYVWGAQLKRYPVNDAGGYTYATGYLATTTAAVYDLPYEWNAALASQGILIEEARTNAFTNSQTLSAAAWTSQDVTTTPDAAVAPDGTTTAEGTVAITGGTIVHQIFFTNSALNGTYTFSVFAKQNAGRYLTLSVADGAGSYAMGVYDLQGGSVTQSAVSTSISAQVATIVDAGNGWYRCILKYVTTALNVYRVISTANAGTFTPDTLGRQAYAQSSESYYLWGAQHEVGTFPTSPIHTIAATVTRASDTISIATSAFPYGSTESTVIMASNTYYLSSGTDYWELYQASGERTDVYSATATLHGENVQGGSTNVDITKAGLVVNTNTKTALAMKANDFAFCKDNGTVGTDVANTMPTAATIFTLGYDTAGNGLRTIYIRQVTYLKRRATDGQLGTLTT